MSEIDVFVSVGAPSSPKQETFIRAVEDRLRAEGLIPHTVGRNTFKSNAPLKNVIQLMDECVGTVIIALERAYFPDGVEKRGGENEKSLMDVRLATPWNQIEAALAVGKGLPILVIVEHGLKSEGLLERGHDWYVQWVHVEPAALVTAEFNGVLLDWKRKLSLKPARTSEGKSPAELTIGELAGSLKPAQLWSLLGVLTTLVVGAFALGGQLFGR